MGLSGVKKRSKLSQDPNNTAWSKSTTTFGHRILSKQGWKPGEYLGAENASHSDHYTAANASHIRVLLREENLGLGAQVGKGSAETFGLSMFSGLLGRLNGKSDGEVQKQQDAIRDVELRTYTGQKYGFMNFVSGGLLLGDKIEPPKLNTTTGGKGASSKDGNLSSKKRKMMGDNDDVDKVEKTLKKRKSEKTTTNNGEGSVDARRASKRKSKCKENLAEEDSSASGFVKANNLKGKRQRPDPRKAETVAKSSQQSNEDENARLKDEKRARKEERQRRREEKRKRRAAKESGLPKTTPPSAVTSEIEGTPTAPTLQTYVGRQAVRQRYIQQKRLVSMDPKALNEIFMLQAKTAA